MVENGIDEAGTICRSQISEDRLDLLAIKPSTNEEGPPSTNTASHADMDSRTGVSREGPHNPIDDRYWVPATGHNLRYRYEEEPGSLLLVHRTLAHFLIAC